MKVQVIQPFAVSPIEQYNIGDMMEVDAKTAKALIAAGRVIEGQLTPYVNPVVSFAKNTPSVAIAPSPVVIDATPVPTKAEQRAAAKAAVKAAAKAAKAK